MLDRVRCLHCHGAFGIAMLQQHGTLWRDRTTVKNSIFVCLGLCRLSLLTSLLWCSPPLDWRMLGCMG